MDARCSNCGGTLLPSMPGTPAICPRCGTPYGASPGGAPPGFGAPPGYGPPQGYAPPQGYGPPMPRQGTPFGVPAGGFGVPDGGYGNAPLPLANYAAIPGRASGARLATALIIGVAILGMTLGIVAALVPRASPGSGPSASGGGFSTTQLATLPLAQTPASMAKVTGATADSRAVGGNTMNVSLSGGPYDGMNLDWDAADTSHVSAAYLFASKPVTDASVRTKLQAVLGRRLDANGNFNFGQAYLAYKPDSVSVHVELSMGSEKNAHWKDEMDALWDVVRSTVLGQSVKVTDAEERSWLGKGYSLTTILEVDPATDIDHASSVMTADFPGVSTRQSIGAEYTVAVDHPWFGGAELTWPDKPKATLSEMDLTPPPGLTSFVSQSDVDACVTKTFGAPKRKTPPDHEGSYDTTWDLPGGGEIRVYHHMVAFHLSDYPFAKPMSKSTWIEAMRALDLCGRGK
jgi:hypothetical protein